MRDVDELLCADAYAGCPDPAAALSLGTWTVVFEPNGFERFARTRRCGKLPIPAFVQRKKVSPVHVVEQQCQDRLFVHRDPALAHRAGQAGFRLRHAPGTPAGRPSSPRVPCSPLLRDWED
ncbi:hypothetical protein [Saccharothrix sp. Mg75]|uniref:hypothetical protein n=1 Tax=Saccharothrix sp. Mg75 TaxID=3445357 RepID=UPI003EEDEEB5